MTVAARARGFGRQRAQKQRQGGPSSTPARAGIVFLQPSQGRAARFVDMVADLSRALGRVERFSAPVVVWKTF